MAICLPFQSLNSGTFDFHGQKAIFTPSAAPNANYRSFYYMPEDSNDEIEFSPYFANRGKVTVFFYSKKGDLESFSMRYFDPL